MQSEATPLLTTNNGHKKKITGVLITIVSCILISLSVWLIMKYNTVPIKPVYPPISDLLFDIFNLTSPGNTTVVINRMTAHIVEQYCPFNDMKGVSPFCVDSIDSMTQKQKPLPVILGVGWDPIAGEIKLPIFDLTYEKSQTYTSNSGTIYLVPDQFILVPKNLNNRTSVTTNLPSFIDLYNQYNPNRDTVTSGPFGLSSDMIGDFIHYFDTGNSNLNTVIEYRNNYDLILNPNITKTSSYFDYVVSMLPAEYDDEIYKMFLYYFGTKL